MTAVIESAIQRRSGTDTTLTNWHFACAFGFGMDLWHLFQRFSKVGNSCVTLRILQRIFSSHCVPPAALTNEGSASRHPPYAHRTNPGCSSSMVHGIVMLLDDVRLLGATASRGSSLPQRGTTSADDRNRRAILELLDPNQKQFNGRRRGRLEPLRPSVRSSSSSCGNEHSCDRVAYI